MEPSSYIAILEAPLDEYTVPDRGDTNVANVRHHDGVDRALLSAPTPGKKNPTLVIPYNGMIELGTVGRPVVAAKRAIWVANGLKLPKRPTMLFGPVAVRQLRAFQHAHHLAADGRLGPETLRELGPSFDQYDFLLYEGYPPGSSRDEQLRAAIVAYALWGYNHRAELGYAEFRPMVFMNELLRLPRSEDCSTFATKAYCDAKASDPNGLHYDGYGNTGTMRMHGRLVNLADAQPGALVHYDDPQHVAIHVGHGRVVSHGSEIGPLLLDARYRTIVQVREYVDLAAAA